MAKKKKGKAKAKRARKPKRVTMKKTRTRTTTRVTIKNPESRKAQKHRLLGRIRREATTAAVERLSGNVAKAMRHDHAVDRMTREAERQGWGDFAYEAEERGRAAGDRAYRKRPRRNAKKNPKAPPRRWFDRCLASVDAQRYARDPAAVCGAAWWHMPAHKRAAIVRRYERGTPKQRRFAVGIAKAERNRFDRGRKRPPPRRNPAAMTDSEAIREYERTHWGDRGRQRISQKSAPNPRFGTSTKLGRLVSVVYETNKGGDRAEWEHEFEGRQPDLVYNEGGLMIAGGDYTIEEGGIKG